MNGVTVGWGGWRLNAKSLSTGFCGALWRDERVIARFVAFQAATRVGLWSIHPKKGSSDPCIDRRGVMRAVIAPELVKQKRLHYACEG